MQKNILFIRWKSIGDLAFSLPPLRALRSNFPDSRITYLTSPEFAPVVRGFSVADDVLILDRARLKRFWMGGPKELLKVWRNFSTTRYDIVVDYQGFGETALLTWLTRAPERWGLVHRPTRAWAYTRVVRRDESVHQVDAYLQLLAECGLDITHPQNFFALPAESQEAAARLFQQLGLRPDRPTVFVQPFTSSTQKDWPLEKWLALAQRLREMEIQVLFGGGPADGVRLRPAMARHFPVTAGTDLLTSCSLAARCALVIGADTGLMHLANAAGCRVIVMKHLTAKECPYGHPDWVLTPRQARSWVAEIELQTVQEEILRVLGSESAARSGPAWNKDGHGDS